MTDLIERLEWAVGNAEDHDAEAIEGAITTLTAQAQEIERLKNPWVAVGDMTAAMRDDFIAKGCSFQAHLPNCKPFSEAADWMDETKDSFAGWHSEHHDPDKSAEHYDQPLHIMVIYPPKGPSQ